MDEAKGMSELERSQEALATARGEAPWTFEQRIEIARRHVMKAAREMDERGDMETHAALMLTADTLDDAAQKASDFDFKDHLMKKATYVPTPWRKR